MNLLALLQLTYFTSYGPESHVYQRGWEVPMRLDSNHRLRLSQRYSCAGKLLHPEASVGQ